MCVCVCVCCVVILHARLIIRWGHKRSSYSSPRNYEKLGLANRTSVVCVCLYACTHVQVRVSILPNSTP